MKHRISIALAVSLALFYVSCMWSPETSFFSNFSTRKLVERNKPAAAASCDPMAGGGGGVGGRVGGFGAGGAHFNSYKSDSCGCRLKSNEVVDETALFNALKLEVERALHDNGATIADSCSSGVANFYFVYTLKDVRGRVELTGNRIGMEYYDVRADLHETRN
ncbi:MAG TPA: hypothetical protein VLL54_13360 [Pyrinomonadaceae bacterium]|nr:hypothetical protein [Pyrinomonadaceae bacterium]